MANPEHLEIFWRGVDDWSKWRHSSNKAQFTAEMFLVAFGTIITETLPGFSLR